MKAKSSQIKPNLSTTRGRAPLQSHDQNTAFGSAGKPEGFVETWKKESRSWRWRAVLCLFLSLLLMMMQPSGDALYKAWAAPANLTANASADTEQPDDATGDGEGVPLTIDSKSTAHFLPSWEYAFNLEKYRVKVDERKVGDTTYAVFGDQRSDREWAKLTSADPTGTARVVSATPSLGNFQFGALSLLLPSSSYKSVDYTNGESVEFTHTFGSGIEVPKTMFWYMGYKPYIWVMPAMKPLTTATPGLVGDSNVPKDVLAPFGEAAYNGSMDMTKYDSVVTYSSNATSSNEDKYFYGSWTKASDYSVQVFMPNGVGSSAGTDDFGLIASFDKLSWDTEIDVAARYEASDPTGGYDPETGADEGEYSYILKNSELSWFVYTVKNNMPVSQTSTVAIGNTLTFGSIANPNNQVDPKFDPAYWGTMYGGTDGETSATLGLVPGLSIAYYANGGTVTDLNASRTVQALSGTTVTDVGDDRKRYALRAKATIPSDWRTVKASPSDVGISAVDAQGNELTFLGWANTPDAETPTYKTGDRLTAEDGTISSSIALYAVWGDTYDVTIESQYIDSTGATSAGDSVTITKVPQGTPLNEITFDSNFVYSSGADANALDASALGLEKDGYAVSGWSGDGIDGVVESLPSDVAVAADRTLTLNFAPSHTVRFVDGETVLNTVVVADGNTVARPDDPSKVGQTFVGWCSDSGLNTEFSFDVPITDNVDVFAKWTTKMLIVTLNANTADEYSDGRPGHFGENLLDTTQERFVAYGDSLDLSTIIPPVRDGFEFLRWVYPGTTAGPAGGVLANVTENVALEAEWEIVEYDVKFDANGGFFDASQTQSVREFDDAANSLNGAFDMLQVAVPSRSGYDFAGWYTMPVGGTLLYNPASDPVAGSATTTITEDTTIYAHWEEAAVSEHPESFTLTLHAVDEWGAYRYESDEPGYSTLTRTITVLYGQSVVDAFGGEEEFQTWLNDVAEYEAEGDDDDGTENYIDPKDDPAGYSLGWWTDDEGTDRLVGLRAAITEDYGNLYSIQGSSENASDGKYYHYVTFDAKNTANESNVQLVSSEETFSVSSVSTPTADAGKQFDGWYTAQTGGVKVTTIEAVESGSADASSGNPLKIDQDTTLYAHWKDLSYTVYFMDGTNTITTVPVVAGNSVANPGTPESLGYSKTGYSSTGWYIAATDGSAVDFSQKINGDTMYFAHWKANAVSYPVLYYDGDKELLSYSTSVGENEYATRPATEPTKAGKVFDDWYTSNDTATRTKFGFGSTPITGVTRIYAGWIDPCTVTFYNEDGTSVIGTRTVGQGKNLTGLESIPAKSGYTVDGWYTTKQTDGGGAKITTSDLPITITADTNYYARYAPTKYTIAYTLDGGTLGEGVTNPSEYYVTSEDITLNNPIRDGYTFTGWSGTGLSGSANTSVIIPTGSTGSRAYTAHWSMANYAIEYNLDGGSLASGVTNPASYNANSNSFTLNNPSKEGFIFAGWTGSNGDTPQTSVTVAKGTTGNLSYTANWSEIPTKTLTFNWNDDASNPTVTSVSQNSGTFAAPDASSAPARSGYHFVGWAKGAAVADGAATRADYDAGTYTYTPVAYGADMAEDTYYAVWEPVVTVQAAVVSGSPSDAQVSPATSSSVGAVTGIDTATDTAFSATYTASPTDTSGNAKFNSWSTDGALPASATAASITVGPSNLKADMTKDQYESTTFTASFDQVHTLTFQLGEGAKWDGDASTDAKTIKVVHGDGVSLSSFPKTTPDAGYSGNVVWSPDLQTPVTADAAYTASYNGTTPTIAFKLASSVDSTKYRLSSGSLTVTYNQAMGSADIPTLQKLVGADPTQDASWENVTTVNDARYTGALNWSPTLTEGTRITADGTYTATPVEQMKTVKVTVVGGAFAGGATTKQYTDIAYGASTNAIAGLAADVNGITANTGKDLTKKTWSPADPTAAGTKVEPTEVGDVVYTLTLGDETHTATFELNDNALFNDAQLNDGSVIQVANVAYGKTVAQASGSFTEPTLAKKSATSEATYQEKYGATPSVTWTVKGSDPVETVPDPMAYALTKDVTFVATPTLADVTVTFKLDATSAAQWSDGTTADKTVAVKYGDDLSAKVPSDAAIKAKGGYKQNSGTWGTGDDDPTKITSFRGVKKEFIYSFSPAKADTIQVVHGTWDGTSDTFTVDNSASDDATIDSADIAAKLAGIIAEDGYTTVGYWDTDPSGESITGGKTYTYTLRKARTVTFKVENGTWATGGGNADKVYTVPEGLTLKDGWLSTDASQTYAAPPAVTAASGWATSGTGAGWYKDSAEVVTGVYEATAINDGNADVVYTYKMAKSKTGYTINVYLQNIDAASNAVSTADSGYTKDTSLSQTASNSKETGSKLEWKKEFTVPAGFEYSKVRELPDEEYVLDGDASNNVLNVYLDRKQGKVTYDWGSANIPEGYVLPVDSKDYYYGADVTVETVTVPAGYTFNGWTNALTTNAAQSTETMPANTSGEVGLRLTGSWTQKTVPVKFELGKDMSGKGTIGTTSTPANVKVGDTITFPATMPVGDQYEFHRWTTDGASADSSPVSSTASFVVTSAWFTDHPSGITYYAWWLDKAQIRYLRDTDGVATFAEPEPAYVGTDGVVPDPPTESHNPGYLFKGWLVPAGTRYVDGAETRTLASDAVITSGDELYNKIIGQTPKSSIDFVAEYEGLNHALEISGTSETGVSLTGYTTPSGLQTGSSVTLPTTTQLTKTGYTLAGFNVEGDANDGSVSYGESKTIGETAYEHFIKPGATFKVLCNDTATTTQLAPGSEYKITATPIWTANTKKVTVRYVADEGSPALPTTVTIGSEEKVPTFDVAYDATFTLSNTSSATEVTGYNFAGYKVTSGTVQSESGKESTDGDYQFKMGDTAVTVTGYYKIKKYELRYSFGGETYKAADKPAAQLLRSSTAVTKDTVSYGASVETHTSTITVGDYDTRKYTNSIQWANPDGFTAIGATGGLQTEGKADGTEGYYTITATLPDRLYDITLTVNGGTYDDATANARRLTRVPYETTLADAFGTGYANFDKGKLAASGAGSTLPVWSPYDPTLAANSGNKVTSAMAFTVTYTPSYKVKFVLDGGKWNENNSTTLEYEVVSGKSLEESGITVPAPGADATRDTVTGYATTGSWDATPDKDLAITGNKTYTYSFDLADVGYTVQKYYQSLENYSVYDYSNSLSITDKTAKYKSTVSKATLGDDAKAKDAKYKDAPVDNAGKKESIVIGDNSTANVLKFYYDLLDINYTYSWAGEAPSTATLPDGGSVKYGAAIDVADTPANAENKVFSGWKVGSQDVASLSNYADGKLTLTEDVAITGTWTTAARNVSYTIDPQVDATPYGSESPETATIEDGAAVIWLGGTAGDSTSGTQALSVSGSMTPLTTTADDNALAATAHHGVVGTDISPEVKATVDGVEKTYKYSDKYAFDCWTYEVSADGTNYVQQVDGTGQPLRVNDPSDVRVTGGDYRFTAHFKLKTSTITYSEGTYCGELSGQEGETVFTGVKFGEVIPQPKEGVQGISSTSYRNASVKASLANSYTVISPYWQSSPAGFYATVSESGKANRAYEPAITFTPVVEEQPYEVYFYLYTDSDSTTTQDYITPNVANGTSGGDSNGPKYSESVFKNMRDAYPAIATPTSTKGTFNGWRVGYVGAAVSTAPTGDADIKTAYAAAKGTLTGDFTVSSAASISGAEAAGSRKLLVFAQWQASPTLLTYHSNPASGTDQTYTVKTGLTVGGSATVLGNEDVAKAVKSAKAASFRGQEGYSFKGWATDKTATVATYEKGDAFGPLGAVGTNNLYAVWGQDTYKIVWLDVNDKEIESATQASELYTAEGNITAPDKKLVVGDDDSIVIAKWIASTGDEFSADVKDGNLSTKPTSANPIVYMRPVTAGTVKLTYAANGGTFAIGESTTGTVWSETRGKVGPNYEKAEFDIDAAAASLKPQRPGYSFKGWSTDGTEGGIVSGAAYEASEPTTLRAIYEPARTKYVVQRYYEQNDGVGDYAKGGAEGDRYELYALTGIEIDGLTQGYDAAKDGNGVVVATRDDVVANTYKGYSFNGAISGQKVTPSADSVQEISLYYNVKSYTVTYEFTGLDAGDVGKYAPNPASVTVKSGETYNFENVPAAPSGYAYDFADEVTPQWQYSLKNGNVATGAAEGSIAVTGDIKVYLPFKARLFTVSYTVNSASPFFSAWEETPAVASEPVREGSTPTLVSSLKTKAAPTEGTYASIGWYVYPYSEGDETVEPAKYTVTQDVTFVAAYAPVHTVTYMAGDHSKTPFADLFEQTVFDGTILGEVDYSTSKVALAYKSDGKAADLSSLEAEEGYEFTGWLVENLSDGTSHNNVKPGDSAWPFNGETANKDYKLTAQWRESEQTVTFLYGDPAASGRPAGAAFTTVTGRTNTEASVPAAPVPAANYVFDGWALESGKGLASLMPGDGAKFFIPTVDSTYEATYKAEKSSIQITTDGNGKVSRDKIEVDKVGNEAAVAGYPVTPTPNDGYHFAGWEKADGNDEFRSFTGDKNASIGDDGVLTVKADGNGVLNDAKYRATFAKNAYKVTFTNPAGAETGPTGTYKVTYGNDEEAAYLLVEHGATVGNRIALADLQGKDHAQFIGWSYKMGGTTHSVENAGLEGEGDFSDLAITGDADFTANWAYVPAALSFSKGADSESEAYATTTGAVIGWAESDGMHVGQTVKLSAARGSFARAGYDQIGWSTTSDSSTADYALDGDYTFTSASATLYPVWSKGTVKVVYHANYSQIGSTADLADDGEYSVDVEYGAPDVKAQESMFAAPSHARESDGVSVPSEAVELKYWSATPFDPFADDVAEEADGTTYKVDDPIASESLQGDLDLYAIWQDKQYKITFDGNENTGGLAPDPDTVYVTYGERASIPANRYTRTDYNFAYWAVSNPGEGDATAGNGTGAGTMYEFKATHDLVFRAHWNIEPGKSATITVQLFDPDDNLYFGGSDGAKQTNLTINATPLLNFENPLTDQKHFSFDGWYTNNNRSAFSSGLIPFALKSDFTIKQIFEADAGNMKDYAGIWDATGNDFKEAYQDGKGKPIVNLYAKVTQVGYSVAYDMNEPGEYAAVAPMLVDEFFMSNGAEQGRATAYDSGGKPTAYDKAIASNAHATDFPGYTFLGWVRSSAAPAGTFDTLADAAQSVGGVAVPADYSVASGTLDPQATGAVTLHAAWKSDAYAIEFNRTYDGDGVTDAAESQPYDTVPDAVWATPVALNAGTAALTANETAYPGNPDFVFQGWFVKDAVGNERVLNYGVDKLGDLFATYGDASSTLNVYAKWQRVGVKLVYATGADADVSANGLTEPGKTFAPKRVVVSPTVAVTEDLKAPAGSDRFLKPGHTHIGWKATDSSEDKRQIASVTFPANTTDDISVYPLFTENTYNVEYVYATGGLNVSSLTRAKGSTGSSLGTVPGQSFESPRGVFADTDYATDPVLPGYSFSGWYSTPSLDGVPVKAAGADNDTAASVTVKSLMAAQGVTDEDNATVRLYAKWEPKAYTVEYDLDGGTYNGAPRLDSKAIDDFQETSYDDLVPDPAHLQKDNYHAPVWHLVGVYNGRPYDQRVDDLDIKTYEQLVAVYRAATGSPVSDVPASLKLKAFYEQDTVPITFQVQPGFTGHAHLIGGDINDAQTTQYQISVGVVDGTLNGDGSTQAPLITAVGDAAYSVAGWYFGAVGEGNEVAGGSAYQLPMNAGNDQGAQGGTSYVAATYVAGINADKVTSTAVYRYAGTDGAYHEDSSLKSKTGSDSYSLTVDTVMAAGDYYEAGNQTGFTYDGAGGQITVSPEPGDNVLYLDYNRNQYDVNYQWAFEAPGPDSRPALLEPTKAYYEADVNVPADQVTPVTGYQWDGWYDADPTENASAQKLTGTFEMPASDKALYGYWTRDSYQVAFDGVFASESDAFSHGSTLSGKFSLTRHGEDSDAVTVPSGRSVAEAVPGFEVYLRDIDTSMPESDTAQIQVSYGGNTSFITWAYKVGDEVRITDDPANVEIAQDTTFYAIASPAQVVSYLPGDHGAFSTVDGSTRSVDIPKGYDVRDYLYDGGFSYTSNVGKAMEKVAGPLEGNAENSDNLGLPVGYVGWKFAGWEWRIIDGPTVLTGSNKGADDPLHDLTAKQGDAIPGRLNGSITFTALWEPATSLLVYDLNDGDSPVAATWVTPGFDSAEGYRYATGQKVEPLPTADDVERLGHTFQGWIWTDNGFDYEYDDSFTMPAAYHNAKTVLKARWSVDPVAITYASSDASRGSVSPSGADPVITKAVVASAEGAGSTAEALPGYVFDGWFKGSVAEANRVADASQRTLVPAPADAATGRYESADYIASFKPVSLKVDFAVAEGQEHMGSIADGDDALPFAVDFGTSLQSMQGVTATANPGYELASPNCWSYQWTDLSTGKEVTGWTSDPTDPDLKITGDATFTAHFKDSEGDWTVSYVTSGPGYDASGAKIADVESSSAFVPVKRGFHEANLGAGNVPNATGYDFAGWYFGDQEIDASTTYSSLVDNDVTKVSVVLNARYLEMTGFRIVFDSNSGGKATDAVPANPDEQQGGNVLAGATWTTLVNGAGRGADAETNAFTMLNPTWPGHTFMGWTVEKDNADAEPIEGLAYDDDGQSGITYADLAVLAGVNDARPGVTVYAKWLSDDFGVVYRDAADAPADEAITDEIVPDLSVNSPVAHIAWDSMTRTFIRWTYMTGEGDVKAVDADTTVADLAAADAVMDGGRYVITAQWEPKRVYKTVYLPYSPVVDAATGLVVDYQVNPQLNENGTNAWIDSYAQLVKGEGYASVGAEARSYYLLEDRDSASPAYGASDEIPGYLFNDITARQLTVRDGHLPWWEPYTVGDEDVTFYIPVIGQLKYKVQYDMNDKEGQSAYPGGDITSEKSYQDKEVRSFTTTDNIPALAGEGEDDAPERHGFNFRGWFNQPSDDDGEFIAEKVVDADHEKMYGELSVDGEGNWMQPADGDDGYRYLKLYAKWIEKKHAVKYAVGNDDGSQKGVSIKLADEDDDAFSAATREEVIGAATGDLFTEVNGKLVRGKTTKGVIAKVNDRGYTFAGWYVVSEGDDPAIDLDLKNVLGTGAISLSAASVPSAVARIKAQPMLSAAAVGDEHLYAGPSQLSIAPGVNDDNVFPGIDVGDGADGESVDITYVAKVKTNDPVTAKLYPNGVDDPESAIAYTQPSGTYVGEVEGASGWGENLGELPTPANAPEGYYFAGWLLPEGTTYANAEGGIETVPEGGLVVLPESDIAKRVIMTEDLGDLPIVAQWSEVPVSTLSFDPNGGDGEMDPILAEVGSPVVLPACAFTRDSYTFTGWNTRANGSGSSYAAGDGYVMPGEDSVLYAQWERSAQFVVSVEPTIKPDGTYVPGTDIAVPRDAVLTVDQINQVLNRGGQTPSLWAVRLYGEEPVTMSTDGLVKLLRDTPIVGNASISVSPRATWGDKVVIGDDEPGGTPDTLRSASPTTGDVLAPLVAGLGFAVLASLLVLAFIRRRKADE